MQNNFKPKMNLETQKSLSKEDIYESLDNEKEEEKARDILNNYDHLSYNFVSRFFSGPEGKELEFQYADFNSIDFDKILENYKPGTILVNNNSDSVKMVNIEKERVEIMGNVVSKEIHSKNREIIKDKIESNSLNILFNTLEGAEELETFTDFFNRIQKENPSAIFPDHEYSTICTRIVSDYVAARDIYLKEEKNLEKLHKFKKEIEYKRHTEQEIFTKELDLTYETGNDEKTLEFFLAFLNYTGEIDKFKKEFDLPKFPDFLEQDSDTVRQDLDSFAENYNGTGEPSEIILPGTLIIARFGDIKKKEYTSIEGVKHDRRIYNDDEVGLFAECIRLANYDKVITSFVKLNNNFANRKVLVLEKKA